MYIYICQGFGRLVIRPFVVSHDGFYWLVGGFLVLGGLEMEKEMERKYIS